MPNEINFLYKPFFKNKKGIIQVDLDGTLAEYTEWRGIQYIGDPIPEMVRAVKSWIHDGHKVEIFTARANDPESIPYIMEWCRKYLGTDALLITPTKSKDVEEIWDDKSINPVVLKNFNDIMKIQLDPANVKCNDYMHGLSNGLILGKALVTGEEPKFIEKYKPFFERTVYDWKGQGNEITNRTWKDRQKIKGAVENAPYLQISDFDRRTGIITYLVEPTDTEADRQAGKIHNPKRELDFQGHWKPGSTNAYTVELQFDEWNRWIDDWNNLSLDEFKDFLKVCDVKWFCSCPAWNYWGMKYQATRDDSSIYKQNISDSGVRASGKKTKDYTGQPRPSLCKHCLAVEAKLLRRPEQVLREIQISLGLKPTQTKKKVVKEPEVNPVSSIKKSVDIKKFPEPEIRAISKKTPPEKETLPEPEIKPVSKKPSVKKKFPEPEIKAVSKKPVAKKILPEPEIEPIESGEEETEE